MKWRRREKKKPALYNRDELMPPEGVPLHLEVAGVGARMAAQITDILITGIGAIAIIILLVMINLTSPQTLGAVGMMLFFIIRIPYYVLTELAWNGQTLGKKLMKIKVVSHDGLSLSAHSLVVRNLMKEAEIFLPGTLVLTLDAASPISSLIAFAWIIGTLLVPVLNKRRQRLGDMIAGTYVIHLPMPVLLKDLAQSVPQPQLKKGKFTFLSHQLDHYGAFELQTLEDLLRAQENRTSAQMNAHQNATIESVIEKIRRKISYADPVSAPDRVAFLRAFYNAQRAHLEQKQLFGERRKNKFHAEQDDEK
ncbi:RDD family protein [Yoonia sp. SDW83-1]|uniref:RDD family protein n=1 Tax=Yoonia sp. SDW83-1 TaxID=3366945 RepID=UPI00398C5509